MGTNKRNSNWYVINVVSGKDEKAKELLEFELKIKNLDQYVNDIVIPVEKYKSVKNKKTVIKERSILNGYMLMNVNHMHPEIIDTVNTTNFVIGFLGQTRRSRKNPYPISEKEATRMLLKHTQEPIELDIDVEDTVEIIDGAFKSFKGTVRTIDNEKGKARVSVKVFGRETMVDIELIAIKKEIV